MTAPRISRSRPSIISLGTGQRWYQSAVGRVLALVVFSAFGGVAVLAFAAWIGAQQ